MAMAASSWIKEITMLDVRNIDLHSLAQALEDHSPDASWWLDPRTGEVESRFDSPLEDDEDDPEARGLIPIEPIPSSEAYRDMEDFIARVHDPRARDLLERAIAGRGAFRRFKDTLLEFPELREAWFAFHDARMERRAIGWLADAGLIDPHVAEKNIGTGDPVLPALGPPLDPLDIVRQVAHDLRALYGERLRGVMLFGSWARGDAHPESDVDLLVVLDRVESPWKELRRMDYLLWRHSFEHDTVISAIPVAEAELRDPRRPIVIRAIAEGQRVA
jgi:hypothetical protein